MAQLPDASVDDKKVHVRGLSVNDVGFFEGPEKLLEMWFRLQPQSSTNCDSTNDLETSNSGLRIIPRYVYYRTFVQCILKCFSLNKLHCTHKN